MSTDTAAGAAAGEQVGFGLVSGGLVDEVHSVAGQAPGHELGAQLVVDVPMLC